MFGCISYFPKCEAEQRSYLEGFRARSFSLEVLWQKFLPYYYSNRFLISKFQTYVSYFLLNIIRRVERCLASKVAFQVSKTSTVAQSTISKVLQFFLQRLWSWRLVTILPTLSPSCLDGPGSQKLFTRTVDNARQSVQSAPLTYRDQQLSVQLNVPRLVPVVSHLPGLSTSQAS